VDVVRTDVSEEYAASILRVEKLSASENSVRHLMRHGVAWLRKEVSHCIGTLEKSVY
jgi:hypothetical protein